MPAPEHCLACPLSYYRSQIVNMYIVGTNPQVMVVGEGPGVQEDYQGRPFIGPTGSFLTQELNRYGIRDYALTNATRCYPGEDKKEAELAKGIEECNEYLLEDIREIKPKVIIALGAWAVRSLGFTDPINTIVNHCLIGPENVPVIISYHPASYMRDTGSIHLFSLAVYKAFRVLKGLEVGPTWEPHVISCDEFFATYPEDVTIDTETDSKDARTANPFLIQVTRDEGTWLVDLTSHKELEKLKQIWTDAKVKKNGQNFSYDIQVIERLLGAEVAGFAWDTMLAEHLLHEESHYNLETLRGIYTNQPVYERDLRLWKDEKVKVASGTVIKKVKHKEPDGFYKNGNPKQKTVVEEVSVQQWKTVKQGDTINGYDGVPREIIVPYGVYDSQTEHMVYKVQSENYPLVLNKLLHRVVLPMQLACADMERGGVRVNVSRLPEMREYYAAQTAELEARIFKSVDEEFKLTSPPEVKRVLYEELGLPKPPVRSKKTGEPSTGKKAIDWLITHANHPILKDLNEWRGIDQIQKAFLGKPDKNGEISKGLMSHIDNERLYTTFRLTLETGRQASSPNLQNLPQMSKGPIRELIIADEGNVLLQSDYSQVELRVAAYLSGDQKLISMLEDKDGDVHTYFARRLFPLEPDLPNYEWKKKYDPLRTMAKRFTFGRLFGQGEQGMALTFNIPVEEAARFQQVYSDLFPNMTEWWEKTIYQVRQGNPLVTVWGRHRRFPAFEFFRNVQWKGKFGLFSHMEREALNFMPQGTATDTLSMATINIRNRIKQFNLPLSLRLVVHDALTVECAEKDKVWAAKFLTAEMEEVGKEFGWTLPVEVKHGKTWAAELGDVK